MTVSEGCQRRAFTSNVEMRDLSGRPIRCFGKVYITAPPELFENLDLVARVCSLVLEIKSTFATKKGEEEAKTMLQGLQVTHGIAKTSGQIVRDEYLRAEDRVGLRLIDLSAHFVKVVG